MTDRLQQLEDEPEKGNQRRRNRPPRIPEMHGMGRHRPGVDLRRRRSDFAPVRRGDARKPAVRLHLRADQRQPHRLQQARQHRRHRDPAGRIGQDRCRPRQPRLPDSHRRPHPFLQARRVRHPRTDSLLASQSLLRAGRARYVRRRRKKMYLEAVRKKYEGQRLVQLRPQGRSFHWTRQRGAA